MINSNSITQIGFTSYSFKKLTKSGNKCLEEKYCQNYIYEICFFNCLHRNLNQTYGCLPNVNNNLQLDFQYHYVSRGYRTCNNFIVINLTIEMSFATKCNDICLTEWDSIYYNARVTAVKPLNRNNLTVVQLFPVKFQHFFIHWKFWYGFKSTYL
jgi:hypothetical protein